MKIKIPTYKIQRVLDTENEFEIPDEITYLFQGGARHALRLESVMTDWKVESATGPETFDYLSVICVSDCYETFIKEKKFRIDQITEILTKPENNREDFNLLWYITNKNQWMVRSKEDFEDDFNKVLNKINKRLMNT